MTLVSERRRFFDNGLKMLMVRNFVISWHYYHNGIWVLLHRVPRRQSYSGCGVS